MFRLECGDKIECKFGGEYGTLTRKFVRKLTWNDQGKSDFFFNCGRNLQSHWLDPKLPAGAFCLISMSTTTFYSIFSKVCSHSVYVSFFNTRFMFLIRPRKMLRTWLEFRFDFDCRRVIVVILLGTRVCGSELSQDC